MTCSGAWPTRATFLNRLLSLGPSECLGRLTFHLCGQCFGDERLQAST